MQFKIEKISEDSFYLNLLLGLPKLLHKYKKLGVKGYALKRSPQLDENAVSQWERNNGVLLPQDLRNFYISTNGFSFKWTMNFVGQEPDVTGAIEINPLHNLVQMPIAHNIQVIKEGVYYKPALGNDVKIYGLTKFGNNYHVVLVFSRYKFSNNIWIYSPEKKFSYLTSDFTTYFRMCIAHLGIPCWQLLYTPEVVPQWILNVLLYLTPEILLHYDKTDQKKPTKSFINKMDPVIFTGNIREVEEKKPVIKKKSSPKSKKKSIK